MRIAAGRAAPGWPGLVNVARIGPPLLRVEAQSVERLRCGSYAEFVADFARLFIDGARHADGGRGAGSFKCLDFGFVDADQEEVVFVGDVLDGA